MLGRWILVMRVGPELGQGAAPVIGASRRPSRGPLPFSSRGVRYTKELSQHESAVRRGHAIEGHNLDSPMDIIENPSLLFSPVAPAEKFLS